MDISRIGLREPDDYERAIFSRLLTASFTGKEIIQEQLKNCLVASLDDSGSLRLRTNFSEKAPVKYRVPVEGHLVASDGLPLEYLLHVLDGMVSELEIIKYGNPLAKRPDREVLGSMTVIGNG